VNLVGFIIRIYNDARSYECQIYYSVHKSPQIVPALRHYNSSSSRTIKLSVSCV